MASWLLRIYQKNQIRILLFAACFAMITNITTIVLLFDQLEHEALCDQHSEFDQFIEHDHSVHTHQSAAAAVIQSEPLIVPKPHKLDEPPNTLQTNSHKKKKRKKQKQSNTDTSPQQSNENQQETGSSTNSILVPKGTDYVTHEFAKSDIKVTDWKYYLDYTIPKISLPSETNNGADCNHKQFVAARFMHALRKWIWMREYGWFVQYDCPSYLQTEYRPIDLVPHIYQTQCAPFWAADVVYLLSQILTPSMLAIQYGFTMSSLWTANFVDTLQIVDTRKDVVEEYQRLLEDHEYDLSNVQLEYYRMSKRYVQIVEPEKGPIVDVVIMETVPEYHDDVLKYIVSAIKENNGILVIKMTDERIPADMERLIEEIVPRHWLRYDSYIPPFLVQSVPFSQEKYLENYNMTVWITRTESDPCRL